MDQVDYSSDRRWIKWVPFSMGKLVELEADILSCVRSTIETMFVECRQSGHRLWTVAVNKEKPNIPLVMVHGMGGGVGLWVQNLDALAEKRPVYAFDLLGFGRSSRPDFSPNAQLVEKEMVETIEEWRHAMNIDKMVLMGHSLGAYLVSSYALKYPERVKHLFLVDPWGFPEKDKKSMKSYPFLIRAVGSLVQPFNPLAVVRLAGPWGPSLIRRFRSDLKDNYSAMFQDDTILDYIYQCNAQKPSGEAAFHTISMKMGWAKWPMIRRIPDIDANLPITFIYGSRTWMDKECGYQTKHLRPDSHVDVEEIRGAGSEVYAVKPGPFNLLMSRYLHLVDQRMDNENPEIRGAGHHVYSAKPGPFNILMKHYLDLIDERMDNEKTVNDEQLKRSETQGDIEDFPLTQM